MYKAKLWDEDKWNIHSSSYFSSKYVNIFSDDKKEDIKYHEQKYGSQKKNLSSDYLRKDDARDNEENKNSSIFDNLEEEKNERQELKEDEISFKVAKQIFNEMEVTPKTLEEKNNIKTIEEAIKKAIEEEKNAIIIDN